jgi:hypothetical protein
MWWINLWQGLRRIKTYWMISVGSWAPDGTLCFKAIRKTDPRFALTAINNRVQTDAIANLQTCRSRRYWN